MRIVTAADIDAALNFPNLIAALADAFCDDVTIPARHHHEIAQPKIPATLLLMPAWTAAALGKAPFLGVKIVSVYPENGVKNLPSVQATYLLMDGATGVPLASLDGTRLTLWRTAAASALAARYLAHEKAAHLVMAGAGALAPFVIRAHMSQRPIERVSLWNHNPYKAKALALSLRDEGLPVEAVSELEDTVREADIVSCATLASAPFVKGSWLKRGAHLDLIGAFTPQMREADDEAVRRADVFIDTPAALTEGGDVALALAAGVIDGSHLRGTLADLCRGHVKGRQGAGEITLFKSVGTALEDLAAATLVWNGLQA